MSEAYRVLVKHLGEASDPSSHSYHSHPFFEFHPGSESSFFDDGYDYEYDEYGEFGDEYYDSDDDVAFYLSVILFPLEIKAYEFHAYSQICFRHFEEQISVCESWFPSVTESYHYLNPNWYISADSNYRRNVKEETSEEYKERLRRSREEQLEAQARRKQESIARKARQEIEREQGKSAVFNTETFYIICFDARAFGSRKKAKK